MGLRGKAKATLNSRRSSIHKQVNFYLKKHGILTSFYGISLKEKCRLFIKAVGWELPENVKPFDFLLSKYITGQYDFLKAHTTRPDIPTSVWKDLRNKVFEKYGKICVFCFTTDDITVDHIKPYSKYPELALSLDNLQPLCRSCNSKKGNRS